MANVVELIVLGKDEASKVLGGIGDAVSSLGTVAVGAGAVAGAAIIGVGAACAKLAIDAAPLADIKASFEGIAEASGTTSEAVLADFKENTAGMLSNADAMAAYNEAAQLITPTFANQLPEAMQYLSKVSASTGEDLDYLVDSLVRGVGRESVAILDNLKVQVDRQAALEAGAEALGKTVDEMSKAERQEALMTETMKKLVENTAALPDVTESANTKIKALQASFTDVKDSIGLALQPALLAVLTPLGDLAERYGPQITTWAEEAGVWLGENLPAAIDWLGEKWNELWPQVSGAVSTGWSIVGPILSTLGGWFSSEGPDAISGLQAVWEDKFGWIGAWVQENMPLIRDTIEVVMLRIEEVTSFVLTGITAFWESHGEQVMAIVTSALDILWTLFDVGLRNIFDVAKLIMQLITGDWEGAGETLKGIASRTWEGVETIFGDALSILGNLVDIGLSDAVQAVVDWYQGMLDAGKHITSGLKQGILDGMSSVKDALVNAVNDAIAAAKAALGISSPSGVFMGIGSLAMQGLALGITGSANVPAAAAATAVTNMAHTTNNYLTMNVQTRATTETVRQGFETMRALV